MGSARRQILSIGQQLALLVDKSRKLFEKTYDEVWTRLESTNALKTYKGREFRFAVLEKTKSGVSSSPANEVIAFERAFTAAENGKWLVELVNALLTAQILKDGAKRVMAAYLKPGARVRKSARTSRPQRGSRTTVLQGATNRIKGFRPSLALSVGLNRMIPRICRVSGTHGNISIRGTGFLVGPQTVITAYHVIKDLLDDDIPKPGTENDFVVQFDVHDANVTDAEIVPEEFKVAKEWFEDHSPQSELDFAVIRLQGSPGRVRGFVTIDDEVLPFSKEERINLLVFQHPDVFPQRLSDGPMKGLVANGGAPRFQHLANTAAGSSGGLCVDEQFKCVGLHLAAILKGNKVVSNEGVLASDIAPRLTAAGDVRPEYDQLMRLRDTLEPVIGRDDFQQDVWHAIRGKSRIVAVRPVSPRIRDCGLSFSLRILRTLLPATDGLVVELPSLQIGGDAPALCLKLLEGCGGKLGAGESFPDSKGAGTTPEAWMRDQLMPDLVRRMAAAAPGRQIWIAIDDLDVNTPQKGDAVQFLALLARSAIDAAMLRFLLIGDGNLLNQIPTTEVLSTPTEWPTEDAFDAYISRYNAEQQLGISDVHREQIVSRIISASQSPANDKVRWKAALDVLDQDVHKLKSRRRP